MDTTIVEGLKYLKMANKVPTTASSTPTRWYRNSISSSFRVLFTQLQASIDPRKDSRFLILILLYFLYTLFIFQSCLCMCVLCDNHYSVKINIKSSNLKDISSVVYRRISSAGEWAFVQKPLLLGFSSHSS